MKNIMCFGDSNTWGFIPGTEMERFDRPDRWPGILEDLLNGQCRLIEEALCGRTTAFDDPLFPDRNGATHLPMLLDSHAPLDLIIIMLGTNDLKHYFKFTAHDIALGAAFLIEQTQNRMPEVPIILIAPPKAVETTTPFGHKFDGAVAISEGLGAAYAEIADERGVEFMDAGKIITCPSTDGVHMDAENHTTLGHALVTPVKRILGLP